MADLNAHGISGPTEFLLIDNTYDGSTETFPITIEDFSNPSGATFTLQPEGARSVTIEGGDEDAIIHLQEAENVTIDGDNQGSDLTIRNNQIPSSFSPNNAVIWLESSTGQGTEDISLENLTIEGPNFDEENNFGIFVGGDIDDYNSQSSALLLEFNDPGSGAGHQNINIQGNSFFNTKIGVHVANDPGTGGDVDIMGNDIGGPSSPNEDMGNRGIVLSHIDNFLITGNEIQNLNPSSFLSGGSCKGLEISNSSNGAVQSNEIHDLESSSSLPNSQGMVFDNNNNIQIFNNLLYDLDVKNSFSGIRPRQPILVYFRDNNSLDLDFNTLIHADTISSSSSIGDIITGLYFEGSQQDLNIRNNIIITRTQTQQSEFDNYAIDIEDTLTTNFTTLDHNAYYSADFIAGIDLSSLSPTNYPDLSSWQSAFNKDLNSIEGDPELENIPIGNLQPSDTSIVIDSATPITSILTDFEGNPRDPVAPDIGAIEPGGDVDSLDVGASAIPSLDSINSQCLESSIPIEIEIQNFEAKSIFPFEVTLKVERNGVLVQDYTETYTDTLEAGQTDTFNVGNFNPAVANGGGSFNFTAYTELTFDNDNSNDTTTHQAEILKSPNIEDQFVCDSTQNFILETDIGGDQVLWYDDLNAQPIETGPNFNNQTITDTKEFYVKNVAENQVCTTKADTFTTFLDLVDADFTADTACENQVTSFTNQTSGGTEPYTFQWDFDDGSTSEDEDPFNFYTSRGTYEVELIAETPNNCRDTATQSTPVYETPTAEFNLPVDTTCQNDSITFQNQSTSDTAALSYEWDFGDDDSSNAENPVHSYSETGTKFVTLTATSSQGCSNQAFDFIEVLERSQADFVVDDACLNEFVGFQNLTDKADDLSNDFLWDLGENDTSKVEDPFPKKFSSTGTYDISLQTVSGGTCTSKVQKEVEIFAVPEPEFTFNDSVCTEEEVNFDNQTPLQSGPLRYSWDFDDGNFANTRNPSKVYSQAGTFEVELFVQDTNDCQATATQDVEIIQGVEASFTAEDGCLDNTFSLDNTTTENNLNVDYSWDFGDGNTSSSENPFHDFSSPGTYEVTLVAEPENGCNDTASRELEVFPEPEAQFEAEDNICVGESIAFENNSFIDEGTMSFFWQFGDGTIGSGTQPSYQYSEGGEYWVTLSATSDEGCRDEYTDTVQIQDPGQSTISISGERCSHREIDLSVNEAPSSDITSFTWNLDDGTIDTGTEVSHTYEEAGTYNITVGLNTEIGCEDTINREVTINPSPQGEITRKGSGCKGETGLFTYESQVPVNAQWQLTSDSTINNDTANFAYDSTGSFPINLELITEEGCSETLNDTAEVLIPPEASFTLDDTVCENSISIARIDSFSSDRQYEWEIAGEGEVVEEEEGEASIQWGAPDTPTVKLTETYPEELNECSASDSQEVIIEPNPESRPFDGPSSVCENEREATYSFNPLAGFEYEWEVDNGNIRVEDPTSIQVEWQDQGEVSLTTIDTETANNCSNTETLTVTLDTLPESDFSLEKTGRAVDFSPKDKSLNGYQWDFGDGNTSIIATASHEYQQPGQYTVKLGVRDENDCRDTTAREISFISTPFGGNCETEFTAYPNPFDQAFEVYFELDENATTEAILYDAAGQKVTTLLPQQELKEGGQRLTLEDHNLSAGVYYGRLFIDGQVCEFEVVKR